MTFTQFRKQFQENPLILSRDIVGFVKNPQVLRNQLTRWEKKGWLIGLKRGVYLLNKNDRRVDIDNNVIANVLYEPSYLSLEYALNFYGIIPEAVADITSVTTRKTMRFSNELGNFIYQKIKPQAFPGFKRMEQKKNSFFIAEAEKAIVDFLYLHLSQFSTNVETRQEAGETPHQSKLSDRFGARVRDVLEHSYRFQNIEGLNSKRLIELGRLFKTKKLTRVIKELVHWIDEVKRD